MTDGFVWHCVELWNTTKRYFRANASWQNLLEGPAAMYDAPRDPQFMWPSNMES